MSDTDQTKRLCLDLIHADTEASIIDLLGQAGYWDDRKVWRYLGDEPYNYSSVGNQQSRAEQAIIEKLINAIDTKLIAAARVSGTDPESASAPSSIWEAREQFFGSLLKDPETLSRDITVAATGAKPPRNPCFTIVDNGEGQTPRKMPSTILSLHTGNKDKIKFVQGKHNVGGTGVLEFCGVERNVQLIVSKQNPTLLPKSLESPADADWSFTVVRREDPAPGEKSSRFTYLAPLNVSEININGDLLHFPSNALPIFPERNKAYARKTQWGTLVKLYEYDAQRFRQNMMLKDGLMYRARLLLPAPALPIRFHECRSGYRGHSGSFDTTMVGLIGTLNDDVDNPKRDNIEWYNKLEFDVDGETFAASIYLFKNKEAADTYRRDEGVLFTYNGQCHASLTKDFFRRKKVKQDYLWHSLLMFVDCSQISIRAHEKLFMNSRDRLRDGNLRRNLEEELEDQLGRHEELRELASERRRKELSEKPKISESMAKVIEKLLQNNPTLAALLGHGLRIKNPHKPESAGAGIAGFIGKRFPTKFHFKGHDPDFKLMRDAHLNSHVRIAFETDAANDYFKREDESGEFALKISKDGKFETATNYQWPLLHNGIANLSLKLPDWAVIDDDLTFVALVMDPSRIEPFKNIFTLKIKSKRVVGSGGSGHSSGSGADQGSDRGSKQGGQGQARDSKLEVPEPIAVYEKEWDNHEPNFNKYTAMQIKEPPLDAELREGRYDYFVNMDNIYLQTYLKAKPKLAGTMKVRFSVGMTLIALALLHQDQLRRKHSSDVDETEALNDVRDKVSEMTSAMAPFLLPMIESISEIVEDDEHLSESAGEAA